MLSIFRFHAIVQVKVKVKVKTRPGDISSNGANDCWHCVRCMYEYIRVLCTCVMPHFDSVAYVVSPPSSTLHPQPPFNPTPNKKMFPFSLL